ncbi:teichoic acid D-Ala incorporation-associated protein DltX [Neobacillus soli]|nr:teichoic acid D-Ala incorporation-associated protein DltX [Neobacillus soli]
MFHKLKVFFTNQKLNWLGRFAYYLLILLLLFFMYGFNDASAGSYIYNDF